MNVKILWLFITLATLCLVIEASVLSEVKIRENYGKWKADVEVEARKLKIKRCANGETGDEKEPESKTEETPKLHRVTLTRTQPVRFEHYQTENENTKKRNERDVNEYEDTKKNQRKLKLNRTNYKNRKTKDRLNESSSDKYAEGEQSRSYIDGTKYRMKRYAVTENLTSDRADYYAQRKAVMDRFHARQKEIAEKYAKKMVTTTPKYVKYDSGNTTKAPTVKNETNNDIINIVNHIDNNETVNTLKFIRQMDTTKNKDAASWFSIKGANSVSTERTINDHYDSSTRKSIRKAKPRTKTNNNIRVRKLGSEEDSEEGKNTYFIDILGDVSSNNGSYAQPNNNNSLPLSSVYSKSGNCGKLVYQHNFIIGVYNASQADADILTSIEGSFCIACVEIVPLKKTKATVRLNTVRKGDGTFSEMMLHIRGFENEELLYAVKVYAVQKVNNRCDHYY